MSSTEIFWTLAGFAAGIAVSFVLVPLWQRAREHAISAQVRWIGGAIVVSIFALASFGLYRTLGAPHVLATQSQNPASANHAQMMASGQGAGADSMENATQRLAQKLASSGGSDADWNLLTQSYEFLGNHDAAEQARQHKVVQGAGQIVEQPAVNAPVLDAAGAKILAEAESARQKRNFTQARAAFEQAIARNAMTADAWADYADTLASQSNSKLSGAPAKAIDAALRIDPRHPKALWLKASLALEEQRYSDAVQLWQQLRAAFPPNSPDVRIVDANIAEARELAQKNIGAHSTANANAPTENTIDGTVDVTPALKKKMKGSMTLFVYAKAADSPGPPLAVLKTDVHAWPVKFHLSDELAMMPNRRLSNFDKVIVEARLSQSGQAMAARGDLQSMSSVIQTGDSRHVALTLSKQIE